MQHDVHAPACTLDGIQIAEVPDDRAKPFTWIRDEIEAEDVEIRDGGQMFESVSPEKPAAAGYQNPQSETAPARE
jgi:hypothetical protein